MSKGFSVLIVEDDERQCSRLSQILSRELPCTILTAANPEQASALFRNTQPEVVVMDLGLDDGNPDSGLSLLSGFSSSDPTARTIVLTGHEGSDIGTEAIRRGASSFLAKPISSIVLTTLVRDFAQTAQFRRMGLDFGEPASLPGFVGNSAPMQNIYKLIRQCARGDSSVLIVGETGTGKELVAQAIHRLSSRSRGTLSVYFGAAPLSMAESELFGYAPGAFTDALRTGSRGAIKQADKGTLFIDELCSLEPELQRKLLRVVEDKSFKPLGSESYEHSDFRLVCAAQPRIYDFVRTGRFREDLFARVEVITISLPPLRERREDIMPLAQSFLAQQRSEFSESGDSCTVSTFSPNARESLLRFSWPRNVRQLSHAVRHGVMHAKLRGSDCIDLQDVGDRLDIVEQRSTPSAPAANSNAALSGTTLRKAVSSLERDLIIAALERNNFALSATSRDLGMGRTTLWRKLRELGVQGATGNPKKDASPTSA